MNMAQIKNILGLNLARTNVILRVDFNCPIEKDQVLDSFRIDQTLKTFAYLLNAGVNKIVVITHLGRPQGAYDLNYSIKPVVNYFKQSIHKIGFPDQVELIDYQESIQENLSQAQASTSRIVFLENIRFWKQEKQPSLEFAKLIANLGFVFINDAFGASHRNHVSVATLGHYLPAYAGLLVKQEIDQIQYILENPERPALAIVGGAKLETKIPVLKLLVRKYDQVLVGGLIAVEIQKNPAKLKQELNASQIKKIILPQGYSDQSQKDIDSETIQLFCDYIEKAKTILWNGPMGKFEEKPYDQGSLTVAKAVAQSKAYKIAGGGETNDLLDQAQVFQQMDFVSTGGGAMLEYISGSKLPGLEILKK
ncbi:MAG: phosphoglycerate kinase [Candidatus Moranbacteria bacterium]|nr:phosphoglycerate kinase [Candidatus Moranbacteria bacterium]